MQIKMIELIQQLKQQVTGDILTRDDVGYEQIRRGWDLTINHYPALILLSQNAADISAGVRFANEYSLGVAVQNTGHGVLYPADDNLLIITSRMSSIHVDVEAKTAQVEAGVTWQQVLDAATPYGLAPLLGSSPHVGVVGYMLGGGIGWLARRYGFGVDSLRWIDIVTADGILRHTSPAENSDIFWGLRGGGGNFGIVTAMEFDLYPVPKIYGGSLSYPGEMASEALRFFRKWINTVPVELTSSIAIIKFPNLPQIPEELRGETQISLFAVYAGDAASGELLIRSWIEWRTPINNTFREMPFSEIGTITNDPVDPTPDFGSSDMLNELSDEAIDVIVNYATNNNSPLIFSILRHAGGAIAQVPPDASAIGNRDATLYLLMGGVAPTPEALEALKTYVLGYRTALEPHTKGGVWMNFMNGNGSAAKERIKEAYLPETYDRLLALKSKVDPNNLFRFSYQLNSSEATDGSVEISKKIEE